MGEDGKVDLLKINQHNVQAGEGGGLVENTINDLTVGSYDVVAQAGPSFTTRREEAKEGMIALLQAAPDIAPLILDKVAKAQDWPMADEIAKRIRANMPPHILQAEEAEEQGASPEEVKAILEQGRQPAPDPKVMEAQANIELKQQDQQFQQQKAMSDAELEREKLMMQQAQVERQAEIEMAKLAEQGRQAQEKLAADIMIEREKIASQERIAMRKAEMDREARERDADLRAAVAKYQTDNRPEPRAGN
jgi:DNA-binding CsgD family transcriptional regulator